MKCGFDVTRLIANDFELDVFRKLSCHARQFPLEAVDNLDRVSARLTPNLERDGGNSVKTRKRPLLFRAVFDSADVAKSNRRAINIRDYQIFKLLADRYNGRACAVPALLYRYSRFRRERQRSDVTGALRTAVIGI